MNGVGVLGDIARSDLRILGVRNGSSVKLASGSAGVLRVTFLPGALFRSAGVDVTTLLSLPTGVFRNWDGEKGSDLIGVLLFGLNGVSMNEQLTTVLSSLSAAC